jgi:(p)ppGpp synthase/HD superfamily hydrolase
MASTLLSARYQYGLDLVTKLFEGRFRKMGNVPYAAHLFAVSGIVSQLSDDEDVRLGALLHDVLEDIPSDLYSAEQLEADFGPKVLELVRTVTHDEVRFGRAESRRQYLRLLQEGPVEACLISSADLLHNNRDELYWYAQTPEEAARVLGGERVKLRRWFAQERYTIIKQRLGARHRLVKELGPVLQEIDEVRQRLGVLSPEAFSV